MFPFKEGETIRWSNSYIIIVSQYISLKFSNFSTSWQVYFENLINKLQIYQAVHHKILTDYIIEFNYKFAFVIMSNIRLTKNTVAVLYLNPPHLRVYSFP